jgi:hypothetical protein
MSASVKAAQTNQLWWRWGLEEYPAPGGFAAEEQFWSNPGLFSKIMKGMAEV